MLYELHSLVQFIDLEVLGSASLTVVGSVQPGHASIDHEHRMEPRCLDLFLELLVGSLNPLDELRECRIPIKENLASVFESVIVGGCDSENFHFVFLLCG